MSSKAPLVLRDTSPLLRFLRENLIGRKGKNPLRFAPQVAPRTQPPPDLPEGPAHRLSNNYYYLHDARREVVPPALVTDNTVKVLSTGTEGDAVKKARQPGKVFYWD